MCYLYNIKHLLSVGYIYIGKLLSHIFCFQIDLVLRSYMEGFSLANVRQFLMLT